MHRERRAVTFVALVAVVVVLLVGCRPPRPPGPPPSAHPPVLAFYYVWSDPSSWDRAKIDLPLLGKYSSDDAAVMRQHIRWAKQAGISGFLVGWKSTPTLDARLATLIDVAESEHFKLGLVYQALDFVRNPLPAATVAADLDRFRTAFAGRAPFRMFDKPLVIWSGIGSYAVPDVAAVTGARRAALRILASETSTAGYARVADLVDGMSYYWSSVNPDGNPTYPRRLVDIGQAVHQRRGIWISPAAPGFDARLVGGTTVVDRKAGATLLTEINGAIASSPDAIGLISWNEFSENTYVEPSRNFGTAYIDLLGRRLGAVP